MSARPARRIAQISAPAAAEAPTLPPRNGRDNGSAPSPPGVSIPTSQGPGAPRPRSWPGGHPSEGSREQTARPRRRSADRAAAALAFGLPSEAVTPVL